MIVLAVAAGGGIGAALRWLTDSAVPRPSGFPLGITIANVLGSLLLGLIVGYEVAEAAAWLTPMTVGVLGGFTTFSTWMVDIDTSTSRRDAILVAIVPLVAGLAAALVGLVVGAGMA